MPLFSGYVAVDWSASQTRKTGKDSIWIAVCDAGGTPEPVNPNTREAAMKHIKTLLDKATADGRRLLLGFDFPFGYPLGTAQMLTGQDGWEAVWRRIAKAITDRPNNSNDRYDAAARLNQVFCGVEGPFWGNGLKRDIDDLPRNRPQFVWGEKLLPRFRFAECLAPTAQEVWKLNGVGSVGGQALTGIARLEKLRRGRDDVQVWPFQTRGEGGTHHVLAEIYPSLVDPCPGNAVLDARQVAAVALTLRELDRQEQLGQYLQAPNAMPARVIAEEGLIFGMHAPAGFRAVAARVTHACIID